MSVNKLLARSVTQNAVHDFVACMVTTAVMIVVTTAILFWVESKIPLDGVIFIYFIPTTIAAVRYGSVAGMVAIIASDLAAAYYIYSPQFSLAIPNKNDVFEIVFFSLLAMLAAQVVSGFAHDPLLKETRSPTLGDEIKRLLGGGTVPISRSNNSNKSPANRSTIKDD